MGDKDYDKINYDNINYDNINYDKINYDNIKDSFTIKIKDLSEKEKNKYRIIVDYFKDKNINYNIPKEVHETLKKNKKWNSVNTIDTSFSKFTALINIYDKKLGEEYNKYRVNSIKPLVKEYSNNRKIKNTKTFEYNDDKVLNYKKLLLNLFINYPPLRSDYSTIMLKNYKEDIDNYYKDGVIYFNCLVKNNKQKIKIILNNEDKNIIESLDSEYLYKINRKADDIPHRFSMDIIKFSKDLIGEKISINEFRRSYFTENINNTKKFSFPEAYKSIKTMSKASNTSVDQLVDYYYGISNKE